jgi:co-chaperonin GroES (HSP10)
MKMLADNVLIAEVVEDKQTAGGIILTESIDKASKPGLVLSVGSGANGQLKRGQRVFLDWSKSMPVNVEGNAAVIVHSEHVRAIIGEEE